MKNSVSLSCKNKFVLVFFVALVSGCASKQADYRWVNPNVVDDYSDVGRAARDDWAKKIEGLPIELHSAIAGRSNLSAVEIVQNAVQTDIASSSKEEVMAMSKAQRIVLYVDGVDVPEKADFCLQEKRLRTLSEKSPSVILRGAVCDGPALVAYAKEAGCSVGKQSCDLNTSINHLKKSLTAALYPAPTLKRMRDIGPSAGW